MRWWKRGGVIVAHSSSWRCLLSFPHNTFLTFTFPFSLAVTCTEKWLGGPLENAARKRHWRERNGVAAPEVLLFQTATWTRAILPAQLALRWSAWFESQWNSPRWSLKKACEFGAVIRRSRVLDNLSSHLQIKRVTTAIVHERERRGKVFGFWIEAKMADVKTARAFSTFPPGNISQTLRSVDNNIILWFSFRVKWWTNTNWPRVCWAWRTTPVLLRLDERTKGILKSASHNNTFTLDFGDYHYYSVQTTEGEQISADCRLHPLGLRRTFIISL